MTLGERFWSKVDTSGGDDSCWTWTASRNEDGYGRFRMHGQIVLAHRTSYILTHGHVDSERHVCHSCDNPSCVRPSHLWLGSNADNAADRVTKGRTSSVVGDSKAMAGQIRESPSVSPSTTDQSVT
jgi:hypothetical protein